jgi:hypothetical protein
MSHPNAMIMGGGQLGQAMSVNGMQVMPTGVVFEGVNKIVSFSRSKCPATA